jgi:uncharacterized membrane protein YphA (DoxX/SURF4 family)
VNLVKPSFHIAERGGGSYWTLAILRWVMVIIFISFGIQKFTLQSAQGIALYISNSPFISWLSVFGLRGEAYLLGVTELGIAALLIAGAFIPILSAAGALMGVITFAITWSFLLHDAGRGEMELVDRSDCLEPDGRVHLQGHRVVLCLPRAADRLDAANSDHIAQDVRAGLGRSSGPTSVGHLAAVAEQSKRDRSQPAVRGIAMRSLVPILSDLDARQRHRRPEH